MLFNSVLFALLPALAVAVNDWTKPCTSGICSYDDGDGETTAWSTLHINAASTDALSDITSAAGWEILNCDTKSTDPQDIRLVCVDQAKGCSHLFNGGAENTIIRLPQNCTGGPFARVARTWIDKDQSLPTHLSKRGQTNGQVRGLALDFDFSQMPESRGNVYITAAATNSPVQRDVIRSPAVKRSLHPIRHANRDAQADAVIRDFTAAATKRSPGIGDVFKKVESGVKKGVDAVKSAPKEIADAAKKVEDKAKPVAKKVEDTAKSAAKKVEDTAKSVPKKVEDTAKKVEDTAKKVGTTVGKDAKNAADATAKGAESAIGKIVNSDTGAVEDFVHAIKIGNPTDFDKNFNKKINALNINKNFPILNQSIKCPQQGKIPAFDASLKVDVDVAATVTANIGFIVTGSIIPPKISKLAFTGGLNGDVSATFKVDASAKGDFQTQDIKLFEAGLPGLDFPGILAVGPSFTVNANAKASLGIVADVTVGASVTLPELQFTFPASAGKSSANINPKNAPIKLSVGAAATLTGHAEAHLIPRLDIGVKVLNGIAKATVFADIDTSATLDFTLDATTSGTPVKGTAGKPTVDKNFQSSLGGSVGMSLGVAVNVGADAELKPFFDKNANFQVFQKTFPLFSKKFGDQKRSLPAIDDGRLYKRGLVCPGAGEGAPKNSVVNDIEKAPK